MSVSVESNDLAIWIADTAAAEEQDLPKKIAESRTLQ